MSDIRKITRDWSEILISSLVIVFIVKTFFFTTYLVPTSSMYPIVCPGEKIIVNKMKKDVKRGDVVAFYNPLQKKQRLLKRLIGLPGDRLEIKDHSLYVNGKLQKVYEKLEFLKIDPDDLSYKYCLSIPDNNYYFIGDNVQNSRDSRYWGFVNKNDIIGKAVLIYWPIIKMRKINGWK